jgi:Tol biopolymer transport system component
MDRRWGIAVLIAAVVWMAAGCDRPMPEEKIESLLEHTTGSATPGITDETPFPRSTSVSLTAEASGDASVPQPVSATSTPGSVLGTCNRIVYVSVDIGVQAQIHRIDDTGANSVQLTPSDERSYGPPACSPDGSHIAFISRNSDEFINEVYVMDANGANVKQLTSFDMVAGGPAWSPDGRLIAFSVDLYTDGETTSGAIFTIRADGTGLTQLTDLGVYAWPSGPRWSPDGEQIVFTVIHEQGSDIYVVDVDDFHTTQLTSDGSHRNPEWSPDGQHIAFKSDRDGDREIFVMDADGSNVLQLTHNDVDDLRPRWSPNGDRIVFWSKLDEPFRSDIYTVSTDGSVLMQLTDSGENQEPVWSPDGTRIAFMSGRIEKPGYWDYEIYVMSADGSNAVQLTRNHIDDINPLWCPH